jgi:Sec-independent protein translocase protein TatA
MGMPQGSELVSILVLILLVLGAIRLLPRELPRAARGLGRLAREFKRGLAEEAGNDQAERGKRDF